MPFCMIACITSLLRPHLAMPDIDKGIELKKNLVSRKHCIQPTTDLSKENES